MRKSFLCVFLVLFFLSVVSAQMSDIDKIIYKLKGQEDKIQPPDQRSVRQIYETLELKDKSELLTRVVDEKLVRKLWDEVKSEKNREELIKAGLSEEKTRELLKVWDEIKDERDFIIKKMDELSEGEEKLKESFEKFSSEYVKKKNPALQTVEVEWKDLDRYTIDYIPEGLEPEHLDINFDDGLKLFFPLKDLPMGLKKIIVEASKITYENNIGGKFVVNVTKVYPQKGEGENRWDVEGFEDLAANPYDVVIDFGEDKLGIIKTLEGGFLIEKDAFVELDDRLSKSYVFKNLASDEKSSAVFHDDGVYVFRGRMQTHYSSSSKELVFNELSVGKKRVLTSLGGGVVSGYEKRYLEFNEDPSGEEFILKGDFNSVVARRFIINSSEGIDFVFDDVAGSLHSGHLTKDESLFLQMGYLNAERNLPAASDVFEKRKAVKSSLVDVEGGIGSSGVGDSLQKLFSKIMFLIDRIVGFDEKRSRFLDEEGYFLS